MNMGDQFATYEIAKQLKELGFDEECLGEWQNLKTGYNLVVDIEEDTIYDVPILGAEVYAPLWQQVIDWFRIEHNIRIREVNAESECFGIFSNKIDYAYGDSYEEAREQAILKAIELIKSK